MVVFAKHIHYQQGGMNTALRVTVYFADANKEDPVQVLLQ